MICRSAQGHPHLLKPANETPQAANSHALPLLRPKVPYELRSGLTLIGVRAGDLFQEPYL
jgi:hypothetical protein